MKLINLVGRALFSFIFILAVLGSFSSGEIAMASAQGVPFATLLVPLAGLLACLGGLSILFGFHARLGAMAVVAFLVPVTLVMHRFWGLSDPHVAQMQQVEFMKNLAMIGGALLMIVNGPGPLSVDHRA
jgi:putative oxidoreductase